MAKSHPPAPPLAALPIRDEEGYLRAVIEVSAGSRNKYKFDPSLRGLVLHKVLPLGTSFPYCFGFIPSTLGEDGDPLDLLVLMDEPALPGTVVPCRLLGIIEAEQSEGKKRIRNDRLIAVAQPTHRYRQCKKFSDISKSVIEEVERFFVFYNREQGKTFTPIARHGRSKALAAVEQGRRAFRDRQ